MAVGGFGLGLGGQAPKMFDMSRLDPRLLEIVRSISQNPEVMSRVRQAAQEYGPRLVEALGGRQPAPKPGSFRPAPTPMRPPVGGPNMPTPKPGKLPLGSIVPPPGGWIPITGPTPVQRPVQIPTAPRRAPSPTAPMRPYNPVPAGPSPEQFWKSLAAPTSFEGR